MRLITWVAAASVLAAGCGPSAKDVVEKNRPGLEARVRAVEQFAKKVDSGEVSAAGLRLPAGEKLRFSSGPEAGNALWMHVEHVLGGNAKFAFVRGEEAVLNQAKAALAGGPGWGGAEDAQSSVDKLLKPRYLVLVQVDQVALPDRNLSGKTFTSGSVDFRVYVFDLDDSRELGVVRCKSGNSDEVSSRDKYLSNDRLKTDLQDNARLEVRRAVDK